MMIATRGSANGQTITTTNLEPAQKTVEVSDYQNWYQEANQLEGRVQDTDGYNGISCRRSRRIRTKGTDSTRYDELRPSPYIKTKAAKAVEVVPAQVAVFNTTDKTTINRLASWKLPALPTKTDHTCECGKNCKCPPYVCKAGYCKNNYAVVFATTWCNVCPRMWPVVNELRKRGYIVFYITTGDHRGVIKQFDLQVWPTTLVIDNGKEIARFNGLTDTNVITRFLKTRKQQGIKPKKKAKR